MRRTIGFIIFFLFNIIICYSQVDSIPAVNNDSINNPANNSSFANDANRKTSGKDDAVYELRPAVDIAIIAVGTVWSAYAFTKIYNKTPPSIEQIQSLNKDNINAFDRWAVYPYSKSLDKISYYPFYASIPYPLIYLLTEKNTRKDFFKIAFMYWEAMSITGLLGTNATYHINRFRPYAYSDETTMEKRTGSIAKNSFYAGHVQVVATPTFFMAKVYADYNPDSKIKWVFYGIASIATGATAYMRLRGGEHFPTDILLGTATGALTGILVPQFHKKKIKKDSGMSIMPYSDGEINGFVFNYHFKK